MSAPELPDIFGNYALGEFVEIVSPEAIDWLPQTAGWFWLGAGALLLLARYSWRRLRRWYWNRYRREAASRLQSMAQNSWGLVELNRLLKLTALAAFGRPRVAELSGVQWVDFLNRQCVSAPFQDDLIDLLAVGTYRQVSLEEHQRQQLIAAATLWVTSHENPNYV